MRGSMQKALSITVILSCLAVAGPVRLASAAGIDELQPQERAWLEGAIGGARIDTQSVDFPGTRGAALLSMGIGFRITPQLAFGAEYASSASLSGCQRWDCEGSTWEFMPSFNRASVFGEMRVLDGRVRLRYGIGDVSYCYGSGPGLNLWQMVVDSLDDYASSNYSCNAVHGWAKSASISFHWSIPGNNSVPMSAGLKLGVEEARMRSEPEVGLPPFRYRAVTLTVELGFN